MISTPDQFHTFLSIYFTLGYTQEFTMDCTGVGTLGGNGWNREVRNLTKRRNPRRLLFFVDSFNRRSPNQIERSRIYLTWALVTNKNTTNANV